MTNICWEPDEALWDEWDEAERKADERRNRLNGISKTTSFRCRGIPPPQRSRFNQLWKWYQSNQCKLVITHFRRPCGSSTNARVRACNKAVSSLAKHAGENPLSRPAGGGASANRDARCRRSGAECRESRSHEVNDIPGAMCVV